MLVNTRDARACGATSPTMVRVSDVINSWSNTLTVDIGQRKRFQKTKLVLKVTQAYGNIGADVSDLSH